VRYFRFCTVLLLGRDGVGGRSGERIPVGGEIFRTRPNRPWDPPCLLYDKYRGSSPGVKRPGHGFDHPRRSEVKERVDLYLNSSCGVSWPAVR